ncbi:hypothetical protein BKI52_04880 [marine bacterium AO1-C]|nr:hypothetical protein BKI52_04880 [marine bacterium AO1-C]
MIHKVLTRPEFEKAPPVLIDIGASGKIHSVWKKIARYAICIAFDADDRDFGYVKEESGKYRKLYTFNCIVSDQDVEDSDFYLTQSPHCSSLLPPDEKAVADLAFAEKFQVKKVVKIKTTTLPKVLQELNMHYVDWFKSDSQGIDLRLFKSLGDNIIPKVLVAEFEPGIMDSYVGEDKLHKILSYMDQTQHFWASDMIIKGDRKISPRNLKAVFRSSKMQKLGRFSLKQNAGWAEITYLNQFKTENNFSQRDYLLGWVLSTIQEHHGFALHLAQCGSENFDDVIWSSLIKYSRQKLKQNIVKLKFMPAVRIKINQFLGKD